MMRTSVFNCASLNKHALEIIQKIHGSLVAGAGACDLSVTRMSGVGWGRVCERGGTGHVRGVAGM